VSEQERYLLNGLADGRLNGGQVLREPNARAGDAEGSDGSAFARKNRTADANDPLRVLFVLSTATPSARTFSSSSSRRDRVVMLLGVIAGKP